MSDREFKPAPKSTNAYYKMSEEFRMKINYSTNQLLEFAEMYATQEVEREKRELLEIDEESIDEIGFKWAGMHHRKIDERFSYQQGWTDCLNHLKQSLKD